MNYDPDCIKQLLIDYPAMVRIMYKSWGQNKRKFYYPIKFPKNIMKLNEITKAKNTPKNTKLIPYNSSVLPSLFICHK